ncbi:MAG TPA: VOC family protein [Stellaceae bacterium]|jgi:catechol 2,3-dioxygenase-like lactoylglutathione lyase family enzyme|nr:VOC family protein [Stellaceae bacterium]
MIDHVSIEVRDLARARRFYDAALAPLGFARRFDLDDASGYGEELAPPLKEQALPFWIGHAERGAAANGHICFAAPSRAAVDAFHSAALGAGGSDNGAPGLRPHYHASYYAAFIRDPDGNRIEAVRHRAE